jgi:hypothetical protein
VRAGDWNPREGPLAFAKNGSSSGIEPSGRGGCRPRDKRSFGPTFLSEIPFWSSRSDVKTSSLPLLVCTFQRSGAAVALFGG